MRIIYKKNDDSIRVLRGGHWGSIAQFCRSAVRSSNLPGNRGNSFGFRPSKNMKK